MGDRAGVSVLWWVSDGMIDQINCLFNGGVDLVAEAIRRMECVIDGCHSAIRRMESVLDLQSDRLVGRGRGKLRGRKALRKMEWVIEGFSGCKHWLSF